MKIQAIDLRQKRRVDLGTDSPIPAPLALYLEPTSLCNMRCAFCPTGDTKLRRLRKDGMMDRVTLTKLIADVQAWGIQLHRINLYKDGEPTLHPEFIEFVRLLKASGISRELWVKTNGLTLEPGYNQRLLDSGLNMIGVSINAVSAEGYLKVTKTRLDYDKLVAGVRDLTTRARDANVLIYVKIADSGFTPDEIQKFHDDFGHAPNISVEQLHGWSASDKKDWTLGTNPTTYEGGALVNKVVCPLPFFMLAVNWNGTLSLCNEDWSHATLCGDLREQTLREVWEGEKLRALRIMHLEGRRRDNAACGNCSYLRTLPDNLDAQRAEILARLAPTPVER